MAREFTDDDRGSTVFDHEGNQLGSVDEVRDGNAYVRTSDADSGTDAGIVEDIKSALGWSDDETHELRNDDVTEINDTEVRLRRL